MRKHFNLFKRSLGMEISTDLAYKANFLIRCFALVISDFIGPLIVLLIYNSSSGIPGWKFEEFILFQGTFIFVTGIAHTFLYMIPVHVIENVREGTFDKILIKPFNPLLYLTFSSIDLEGIAEIITGTFLIAWSMIKLDISIFSVNTVYYAMFLLLALLFLYSAMIIISALAFLVVRSFGLFELLFKFMDVARYPMNIYGFEMKLIFTFLIPLAVISFYPASALLGRFSILTFIEILVPVSIFFAISLFAWNLGIKKYTSAGG